MLTLGYLGNGKSTNRYHLPFVLTLSDIIKVKTIFSRSPSKEWPQLDGIHYTHNLDDLLNDPSIDAVVITSPSNTHYDYALRVLQSGKHCLVEKPFTSTSKEAKELFKLAKQQKLVIMPYQNRRFDADLVSLQKVIQAKSLGKLFEVNLSFDTDRFDVASSVDSGTIDNSYLYGIGCHSLDQALTVFGKPRRFTSNAHSILGSGRMNDYYSIQLIYDGLTVNVDGSMNRVKNRPALSAYGTQGIFIKEMRDIQEEHLKSGMTPLQYNFGVEPIERYGSLIDRNGTHTIETPRSSYSLMYQLFYDVITSNVEFDTSIIVLQLEILESTFTSL